MKTVKLLVLFLITLNTYSQTNFIKGTITTNDGKVIEGLIDYKNWRKNPTEIKFKTDNKEYKYTPNDISKFAVLGDAYVSKEILIDKTPQTINYLKVGQEPIFKKDKFFLNVLVLGKINLYLYEDERQHFIVEKNGQIQELIYRKNLNDNSQLTFNKKYLGQLKLFINDCLSDNIDNLEYKYSAINNLIIKYNNCSDGKNLYVKNEEKSHSEFLILAGLINSKINFNKEILYPSATSSSPQIGVGFNLYFSKNRQQWSFLNELTYRSYKYNSTYKQTNTVTLFYVNNLNIDIQQLKIATLIRYYFLFSNANFNPFIDFGIGNGFSIGDKSTESNLTSFGGNETITYKNALGGLRKHEESLLIGIGGRYKDFNLEIRYEKGLDISEVSAYSAYNNNLNLAISYKFL